jgi:nitrite reductase/ring-hydroxylating ferredoxin subunit
MSDQSTTEKTPARKSHKGKRESQPQWAKDFPINVDQDNYAARRDFTKFMVLTSFAFVVGQAWIGMQNVVRRGRGKPPIRRIAEVGKVQIGQAISFAYPESHDSCLLIRKSETEFLAYDQRCTHLSCAIVPRVKDGRLSCPCHEGHFDLDSGRPLAGPPIRALKQIAIQIKGDSVYATGFVEARS